MSSNKTRGQRTYALKALDILLYRVLSGLKVSQPDRDVLNVNGRGHEDSLFPVAPSNGFACSACVTS